MPRVVALGGGHGLAASLTALRLLRGRAVAATSDDAATTATPSPAGTAAPAATDRPAATPAPVDDTVTAVVTVADDGGSSGRLRVELGALPPGDLRMALAALAGTDGSSRTWEQLLQHRFGGTGPLAGHAVGNLLLTGLAELVGPVAALDAVGGLLCAAGRVLPLSTEPVDLVAEVAGLDPGDPTGTRLVHGQVAIATTSGRVRHLATVPAAPAACAEAVAAVHAADWVVLGPGSWFTSVLPHLCVPELAAALERTAARRLVVLNLAAQTGETDGFSPAQHLDVLRYHAPRLRVDVVLADRGAGPAAPPGREALRDAAGSFGARLLLAPVAVGDGTPRHDPARLAAAYDEIFRSSPGSTSDQEFGWQ